MSRPPVALTIAGSDPSGGAGIQADLKTFSALGVYGTAVITALTAQSTQGVTGIHTVPPQFVREQLDTLLADVRVDAIKIGMLSGAPTVEAVTAFLSERSGDRADPDPVVVLDPVMVSTSGSRLLDDDAVAAMRQLVPYASVVTPNLAEAAVLLDQDVARDLDTMRAQAHTLREHGARRVLLKGGHLTGADATDLWLDRDGERLLHARRVLTRNTHGTGCSLSSAIAALAPQRDSWLSAVTDAKSWITGALTAADCLDIGHGPGPVHHFYDLWSRHSPTQDRAEAPGDHSAQGASFSAVAWEAIAPVREAIDRLPLLIALEDGSLPREIFGYYMAQDAHYLTDYGRVLATCAGQATGPDELLFWAASANTTVRVERELHAAHVADFTATEKSPSCTAYTSYLLSLTTGGCYPELAAAILPCFWIYEDVGTRLKNRVSDLTTHPYGDWIGTYGDSSFAESTRTARRIVDHLAAQADPVTLDRMHEAFRRAAQYEWIFWDAAFHQEAWPV